jgi:small Trp-rich protein
MIGSRIPEQDVLCVAGKRHGRTGHDMVHIIRDNPFHKSSELRVDTGAYWGLFRCIVREVDNEFSGGTMIWLYGAVFCLAVAKWVGWEPLLPWSWWWFLLPIGLVVLWFESLERMAGFDSARKLKDATFEKAKKERIANQLKSNRIKR